MTGAKVEIDPGDIRRLASALRAEADGKQLRRELNAGLRAAAEPALVAVRSSILSMPSQGLGKAPSLRTSIAERVRIHVRSGGKRSGVSVEAHSTGLPRKFKRAPRYLNSTKPWRHKVFGNDQVWVSQVSRRPGWFSEPLKAARGPAAEAVAEALRNMARRIAARTRG